MFKNIAKEKGWIDRELAIYKQEQQLVIEEELQAIRKTNADEILDLGVRCADDTAAYEHKFHKGMEKRGIELAKLDAQIEAKEMVIKARDEVVKADQNLVDGMQLEIKTLKDIIDKLIEAQPDNITIYTKK